jgi:hypothetical protein
MIKSAVRFSGMPDRAGGNNPDPEELDRKLRELKEEIRTPKTRELTPLERLVAARQVEQRAQRKRDTRVLTVLGVVAVIIAGGGVFAWLRFAPPTRHHHHVSAAPSVRTTPTVATTPSVATNPTAPLITPLQSLTSNSPPASPFAGSPAVAWADGAAGITIPAARAHGPYTAAVVRSAYETTRQLLIAGNLNWPTLHGGPPTAFADLLTKQQRGQFLAGLRSTALNKDGTEQNTRTWVASFAPGSTQFVTTVVKVRGRMSASLAGDSGSRVLRINYDYLFVYAVEQPGNPSNWLRVVVQEAGSVDFAQWDDPGGPLEPWFNSGGSTDGDLCGTRDGYIHPDYPQGPPPSVQPSGTPVNPYSFATPSGGPANNCQATTGT